MNEAYTAAETIPARRVTASRPSYSMMPTTAARQKQQQQQPRVACVDTERLLVFLGNRDSANGGVCLLSTILRLISYE